MKKKIAIIDSNNISNIAYHRAKSILLKSNKDKKLLEDEKYINRNLVNFSIKIFFNIIHKYIRENKNYIFHFAWDGRFGSKWRKDFNKDYKANRVHSKDSLYWAFLRALEIERQILDAYPVYQFLFENVEADDIIYNLCDVYKDDEVKIISSDADMIQLAQKFNSVIIWNPRTKKNVEIPEYDIVLYKSIIGDKSDNIYGLYKYGPKKTIKTIENNLKNINEKQLKIIEKNKILIDLSKNPNLKNNKNKVINRLQNAKIIMNSEKIKKAFMSLEMRDFLKKWNLIAKMLNELEKESKNGRTKC